jgi:hypothetical protein
MFTNFRKETSERSDASNWAKQKLISDTPYYYESIEGCNENQDNIVTHLLERARVNYDGRDDMPLSDIFAEIIKLETIHVIERKINFAKAFGLNLSYVLYNDETQHVWLYKFDSIDSLSLENIFSSYKEFSNWILSIKGWESKKKFRESDDLPFFDKILRQEGCAWPTNIDCFVSDKNNMPIAVLEFQNANTVSVKNHCNNEYFLCKITYQNRYGYVGYHDDIRRWLSQEILRVQSGLRLFIITWDVDSDDFILKEVDKITFPLLPRQSNWKLHNQYQADMHAYAVHKTKEAALIIANKYDTFNLQYVAPQMKTIVNNPPLNGKDKTFPYIYYKYKEKISNNPMELPILFNNLIKK